MKNKIALFIVVLMLMMSLCGCGNVESKAKKAIVGKWHYDTYFEMSDDEKDTRLKKYFRDSTDVTFKSDGTMYFDGDSGKAVEWEFVEYDERVEAYYYKASTNDGFVYYFCLYPEEPDRMFKYNNFKGKTGLTDFAGRIMTLDLMNDWDNLWNDGNRFYDIGTQFWSYERE